MGKTVPPSSRVSIQFFGHCRDGEIDIVHQRSGTAQQKNGTSKVAIPHTHFSGSKPCLYMVLLRVDMHRLVV